MKFIEAADKVLKENGKPLSVEEITKIILKKKLVKTEGKTPEASVSSLLSADIKNSQSKSLPSRFVLIRRGFYGLAEWGKKNLNYL